MTQLDTLSSQAAWKILFGELSVSDPDRESRYIDSTLLKKVYRRRVFQTHPDRAEALGADRATLEHRMVTINRAYRVLSPQVRLGPVDTVAWRETAKVAHPGPARTPVSVARPQAEPVKRSGITSERELPYRKLPLGRFMYHIGLISWNVLVDALAWQAEHRPLFGELAVELGYLNRAELRLLVSDERAEQKIGECARQMGLLSDDSIRAVMAHQRAHQEPLGQFFVKRGYFSRGELGQVLASHRKHNAQFLKAA